MQRYSFFCTIQKYLCSNCTFLVNLCNSFLATKQFFSLFVMHCFSWVNMANQKARSNEDKDANK